MNINGELRHLGELSNEAPPAGEAFLARAVLEDENAYFEGSDSRGMFRLSAGGYFSAARQRPFISSPSGEMVYTSAIDFSSETMQGFVLDGMLDWDADAEAECQ